MTPESTPSWILKKGVFPSPRRSGTLTARFSGKKLEQINGLTHLYYIHTMEVHTLVKMTDYNAGGMDISSKHHAGWEKLCRLHTVNPKAGKLNHALLSVACV